MKVVKNIMLGSSLFLASWMAGAQTGIGTQTPDVNAVLDVSSEDKGMLIPRMSGAQVDVLATNPGLTEGMMVYNTSEGCIQVYTGTSFECLVVDGAVDLTPDAWVNDNTNNQIKLSTGSDGLTSRSAGTELVVKDDGKLGVGTGNPTAILHSKGTVRLEGLTGGSSNSLFLAADSNGNVETRSLSAFLPSVLIGGDGVDAVPTAVTVSTVSGPNESIITTKSFTLTQSSLVQVNYNISVTNVSKADGANITDGETKLIVTSARLFSGGSAVSGGGSYTGIPFTNSNNNSYAQGHFRLVDNITRVLPAGTYEFRFYGGVHDADGGQGVRATFGTSSFDNIDIIATPTE